ncbi:uncharacterized protein M421DRAFT_48951, partial [Didymella exigua CBS 183.55]
NWLKACTTLQAEVRDSRSVGARKLGQTIHHLSSQVELLQVEVDGLRKKLYQNRKHKKQPNRQLDLQQHQEYHGGAIMWSPRSFREARARMAVADHERQEEEQKKAETKEQAAANKIYNEKIAREKREQRAEKKKARDQAKAKERAAINARKEQRRKDKEARDAEKALKSSQRGNCTSSKASAVKQ